MIDPSLALQGAIRDRLIADPAVTALVSPSHIKSGGFRPDEYPRIILGAGQTVLEAVTLRPRHVRCYLDLHLWTRETGTTGIQTLSSAVVGALNGRPAVPGLIEFEVKSVRHLRDPGDFGHAVVSVEALVEFEL